MEELNQTLLTLLGKIALDRRFKYLNAIFVEYQKFHIEQLNKIAKI